MESLPTDKMPPVTPYTINPEFFNPDLASAFYRRIIEMIHMFEAELDETEEIGIRLVSFGHSIQFHIEDVSYYNPSLITFIGKLGDGAKVKLVQHVSQISFLLMALPKRTENAAPRRIGFTLKESLEE
ncbi:DUF6173 family protein [Falsibacillus albus]|uniref:Uncharacterized protein n=1 Tax=Falsibacillus albus TaxID=2478915 RepID=A0A3L7JXC8_9BACI|nr:DUF6173 family protein [Falsibacillus albus]RLQ95416.1 hypothetical protein D9X91_10290 [Falsibacillus albus]